MGRLLLLFLVIPIAELALLIEVGRHIGTLSTVALIFVTALLGSYLARQQGLSVLRNMQLEMAEGRLPAGSIVDGVLILVAGAVLITPGILTDVFGFLILIPGTRRLVKAFLWKRLENSVRQGTAQMHVHFDQGEGPYGPPPEDENPPRRPQLPG